MAINIYPAYNPLSETLKTARNAVVLSTTLFAVPDTNNYYYEITIPESVPVGLVQIDGIGSASSTYGTYNGYAVLGSTAYTGSNGAVTITYLSTAVSSYTLAVLTTWSTSSSFANLVANAPLSYGHIDPLNTNSYSQSAAFGNGLFVVRGSANVTVGYISTDGINWTTAPGVSPVLASTGNGATTGYNTLAFYNNFFIAPFFISSGTAWSTSPNSAVYVYSTNGSTWATGSTVLSTGLNNVSVVLPRKFAYGNGYWLTAGAYQLSTGAAPTNFRGSGVVISTNLVNWATAGLTTTLSTNNAAGYIFNAESVTFQNGYFFMGSNVSTGRVFYATNPTATVNWATSNTGLAYSPTAIVFGSGVYIAGTNRYNNSDGTAVNIAAGGGVGTDSYAISTNLTTWTLRTIASNVNVGLVSYSNGYFINQKGTTTGQNEKTENSELYVSTDGVSWYAKYPTYTTAYDVASVVVGGVVSSKPFWMMLPSYPSSGNGALANRTYFAQSSIRGFIPPDFSTDLTVTKVNTILASV
jgi:hypothetical protein